PGSWSAPAAPVRGRSWGAMLAPADGSTGRKPAARRVGCRLPPLHHWYARQPARRNRRRPRPHEETPMKKSGLALLAGLSLLPHSAWAAEIDGSQLSVAWGIPFAGVLLSIALMPLVLPWVWHHHYG